MRFETRGDGVAAYMRNRNTHSAYERLRVARGTMRQSNHTIAGSKLAVLLTNYSEIPEEFGQRLLKLMALKRLAAFDGIRLASK